MEDNNSPEPEVAIQGDFYFAIIPEWVLALEVSSNAIRAYCVLRRYADNHTGECYPSRKKLAMRARLSVSTLDRAIKELVDTKAVTVRPRKNDAGDWTSNLYIVHTFPNGGVSLPVMRPRVTGGQTGVVAGGEGTRTIKTRTTNKSSPLVVSKNEDHEFNAGYGMGNAHAMTGQSREDLIELGASQSEVWRKASLEAYDSRVKPRAKPPNPDPQPMRAEETWHSKYD